MNLTSLETLDGSSAPDCARRCTTVIECTAVRVTDAGDNGTKICTMYKEPDGVNVVEESHVYVKE